MPKLQPNLPSTSFTADEIDAALGESFPKKASNNPRTSENLLKARDALAPGKIRFLDNANEAAKTGALPSDTAMRFSLAKTYEIEERKKQCLPPKSRAIVTSQSTLRSSRSMMEIIGAALNISLRRMEK
ncbi:hypothetical protein ACFQVB_41880 [Paraburkholderia humisilvae]|uniref:hypothetical protein n=1 Tax=Paraburkholderia humisilvae TaxID=627669 RepID=UPI0036148B16